MTPYPDGGEGPALSNSRKFLRSIKSYINIVPLFAQRQRGEWQPNINNTKSISRGELGSTPLIHRKLIKINPFNISIGDVILELDGVYGSRAQGHRDR
jgi:hypothetical protein